MVNRMIEHIPYKVRDSSKVFVGGDLVRAIRLLRKQMEKAKVLKEIRDRRNYITRAERRSLKDQRALKRRKRSRKRINS